MHKNNKPAIQQLPGTRPALLEMENNKDKFVRFACPEDLAPTTKPMAQLKTFGLCIYTYIDIPKYLKVST